MKLKVINVSQDTEVEKQMLEIYGEAIVEYLKNNVGKVFTNEENCKILRKAEEIGFVEIKEEKDRDNEEIKEDDGEVKEEVEEEAREEGEDEAIEKNTKEDKNEEVEAESKKKYEKRLRTRAMKMLENLDVYKNLPSEAQYKIISAYEKTVYAEDILDKDFLDKSLNAGENREMIANVRQIHMMVLGGLTVQEHIQNNQQNAEVQLEQSEINSQTAKQMNQIEVRMPKLVTELDFCMRKEAEQELAGKVKKYLEMATTNREVTQTLMIIGDLKSYMENVKKDTLESVDAGEEKEAEKLYLSQMPITEMGAVMAAAKDVTGNVKIRFDDINWDNEIERKVAIGMLAQTQESAKEFGAEVPVVDNVEMKFDIKSWKDIQSLIETCKELKDAGIVDESKVKAQVDIDDNLDPNTKAQLEEAAIAATTSNGVAYGQEEIEDTKENDISNTALAAGIGAAAGVGAGILANEVIESLADGAQEHPEKMKEHFQEMMHEENFELNGPGMSGPENENAKA